MLKHVQIHDSFVKEWTAKNQMTRLKVYITCRALLTESVTFCKLLDVVKHSKMSKHSVSRQIRALVKEGHFVLVPDKNDRRASLIYKRADHKIIDDKINRVSHCRDMWYMGVTKFNVENTFDTSNRALRISIHSVLVSKNFGGNPVTRNTIKDLTGIEKHTQRQYEKERETKKKFTYVTLPENVYNKLSEDQKKSPKLKVINEGQVELQIGNKYIREPDQITAKGSRRRHRQVKKMTRLSFRSVLGRDAYFNKGTGATAPKHISANSKKPCVFTVNRIELGENETYAFFTTGHYFDPRFV